MHNHILNYNNHNQPHSNFFVFLAFPPLWTISICLVSSHHFTISIYFPACICSILVLSCALQEPDRVYKLQQSKQVEMTLNSNLQHYPPMHRGQSKTKTRENNQAKQKQGKTIIHQCQCASLIWWRFFLDLITRHES